MDVEYISCDLCGQDDYEIVIPDCKTLDGPLVRCRHCGLIYVNPRRTNFAVSEETANASAKRIAVWDHYAEICDASLVSDERELEHIQANFELRIQRIRQFKTEGSLLDIGCGKGHFLAVARSSGFSVIGIEPNEKTARFARQAYDLEIIPGVLNQHTFPENRFDIVTMLHVLEHLPSPTQELYKIHRILRPGGFLFIEVPNIDTIWFRLLGHNWRQIITDHYFFFTPQTIHALLQKVGFSVMDNQSIGKKMSAMFLISRLQRYNRTLTSLLAKFAERARIDDREIYLNLGDVMFITAKKV